MGWITTPLVLVAALAVGLQYFLNIGRTIELLGLRKDWTKYEPHVQELLKKCENKHSDVLFACEDIHLVGEHTIYAACLGSIEERRRWLPALAIWDTGVLRGNGGPGLHGKIMKWDIKTDEVRELEIKNLPANQERAYHGFDVNVLPDGSMSFYLINHLSNGSVIQKFTHVPDTSFLVYEETLPYLPNKPGVPRPNDILAVPSLDSENAIFVTNDHGCKVGNILCQKVEAVTGRKWSWFSYYSKSTGWKVVGEGLSSVNGITGTKGDGDDERIYVSELGLGRIVVYSRKGAEIKEIQRVDIGFMGDNPSLSSDGRDLYIAGHTNPLNLEKHSLTAGLENQVHAGSMVKRFNTNQIGSAFFGGKGETSDPIVEEVFVDRWGKLANMSSTAIFVKHPVSEVEEEEEENDEEEDTERVSARPKGDLYLTTVTGRGILKCSNIDA